MYRVYLVNFDYFHQQVFDTLGAAKAAVERWGFEAVIYRGVERVCSWAVFAGWEVACSGDM